MTIPLQSYLELKKETTDIFARKMILRTLKETKGNIRATARRLSCSPNTVYLAIRKAKRKDLRDLPHTPKRRHPNHIEEKKEKMIIDYRKETGLGKRRLRYYIFQREGIAIPESTIGKVIRRSGLPQRRKRVRRHHHAPKYDMESLFPFQEFQVDVKEILDKRTLPRQVYAYLKSSGLPIYQWTAIDVRTRIRFISFSYKKDWFCGRAFLQYVIWWIRAFGFDGPINIQSDGGVEFAASSKGSFERNLKDIFEPLGVTRDVIRKGHPEDNAFVERSHRTDDEEFYIPYLTTIKNEDDLLKRALWWQNMYNLHRPHQGIGDLTPYEKLRSLGYATPEAICLLPPLILDSVCCLKPFQVKVKSVQDHLDYYQSI